MLIGCYAYEHATAILYGKHPVTRVYTPGWIQHSVNFGRRDKAVASLM